jgi:hypothetical protein
MVLKFPFFFHQDQPEPTPIDKCSILRRPAFSGGMRPQLNCSQEIVLGSLIRIILDKD